MSDYEQQADLAGLPLFSGVDVAGSAGEGHRLASPRESVSVAEAIEAGIATADANADQLWKEAAWWALLEVAARGETFTSDDVWEILDTQPHQTHNPSALGGVFRRAAKEGVIRNTGKMRRTRRVVRHRQLTVWVKV